MAEAWQRQHLFEALARAILGHGGPLLLALDDIQWCDPETLGWLHYLLRYDPRARVLVVATLSYTAGQDHPESLRTLTYALRHDELLTEVELGQPWLRTLERDAAGQGRIRLLDREPENGSSLVEATVFDDRSGGPGAERCGELSRLASPLRMSLDGTAAAADHTITVQPLSSQGDLLTARVLISDADHLAAAADFTVTFQPIDGMAGQVLELAGFEVAEARKYFAAPGKALINALHETDLLKPWAVREVNRRFLNRFDSLIS